MGRNAETRRRFASRDGSSERLCERDVLATFSSFGQPLQDHACLKRHDQSIQRRVTVDELDFLHGNAHGVAFAHQSVERGTGE